MSDQLPTGPPPDSFPMTPPKLPPAAVAGLVVLALAVGAVFFVWTFCRVNVQPGEFVILTRKTGENISNDDILAPSDTHKGVQEQVLKEGRHFFNPYTWEWTRPIPATDIPEGKVGVLVRNYGKRPPPGDILAPGPEHKGIVREVLKPGRHYINTFAYAVEVHDAVKIEPGHKGVDVLLAGRKPADPFAFVVAEGEKGVQPSLVSPGTHYDLSNPSVHSVIPLDIRSQRLEMRGAFNISFPSNDGFDIKVDGYCEWALDQEMLAETYVKYVEEGEVLQSQAAGLESIQRRVIVPLARSYFRTVGGRHNAVDYITGDTRRAVQDAVRDRLRESCAERGVLIRAVIIRRTTPPDAIRKQYERRELAKRLLDQYQKEIEREVGAVVMGEDGTPTLDEDGKPVRRGGLVEKVVQERMKDRQEKFGKVRSIVAQEVRGAEQYQRVETTRGEQRLEVAKRHLEAARDKAAAALAKGKADAEVTVLKNTAEANALRAKVSAFGDGETYAYYLLVTRLAPATARILSNTDGPFAELFQRFTTLKDQAGDEKGGAQ